MNDLRAVRPIEPVPVVARIVAPGFHVLLDRIDRALDTGAIEASLPDGTQPAARWARGRAGGDRHDPALARAAAPRCRGLGRLVRRLGGGRLVEPRSGAAVRRCSCATACALGQRRARGRRRCGWPREPGTRLRRNHRAGARRNIAAHYDLGNDFYETWLDASMTYSSAMFDDADEPLEVAQQRKLRAMLAAPAPRRATRSWRSAAAGGRSPAVAAAEGDEVHARDALAEQKARGGGTSAARGHRAPDRLSRRRRAATMRSPASRWSRRSARNIGRPISTRSPACSSPADAPRSSIIAIADDVFRRLCRRRRLHPALRLSGRHAAVRSRGFARWRRRAGWPGMSTIASACDYAETLRRWRVALRCGGGGGAAAARLRRALRRAVALLPDVLRGRLPRRRDRRRQVRVTLTSAIDMTRADRRSLRQPASTIRSPTTSGVLDRCGVFAGIGARAHLGAGGAGIDDRDADRADRRHLRRHRRAAASRTPPWTRHTAPQ